MIKDYEALSDPSDTPEMHRIRFAAFCKKHFGPASEKEIAIRQRYLKAGIACTSHGWPESDIELWESKEVQDILANVTGWNSSNTKERSERRRFLGSSLSHLKK